MELVEGETIEERVHHKGPIDCPIALDIALQITARSDCHRRLGNLFIATSNLQT